MTPFFGFRKNVGVVWKLPLSETSRPPAISICVNPPCCGFGAVDGDVQLGLVEGLLDAQIDDAGHLAHLAEELIGEQAIGFANPRLPPARRWARAARS